MLLGANYLLRGLEVLTCSHKLDLL